jgi:hypothetical protein
MNGKRSKSLVNCVGQIATKNLSDVSGRHMHAHMRTDVVYVASAFQHACMLAVRYEDAD